MLLQGLPVPTAPSCLTEVGCGDSRRAVIGPLLSSSLSPCGPESRSSVSSSDLVMTIQCGPTSEPRASSTVARGKTSASTTPVSGRTGGDGRSKQTAVNSTLSDHLHCFYKGGRGFLRNMSVSVLLGGRDPGVRVVLLNGFSVSAVSVFFLGWGGGAVEHQRLF